MNSNPEFYIRGFLLDLNEKNHEAVAEAMTWLGTPYHHQGRVKGVGVDCGTLICEVYEKVGLMDHLDPRPYPPDWHMHQLGQRYLEHVLSVCYEVDEPQPGDIVLITLASASVMVQLSLNGQRSFTHISIRESSCRMAPKEV
jgi:cell wall-associated NlpC family hydrolase